MRREPGHKIRSGIVGVLLFMLAGLSVVEGQIFGSLNQFGLAEALHIRFSQKEVSLDEGQIISNVLIVTNTSQDTALFYITLNFPPNWKALFNSEKLYTLSGNDSIFIPVRIIPGAMMKGDTKYFINAYFENAKHVQFASEYFFASTDRISQWDLDVDPGTRIYFKNNENIASFNIGVLNSGNEKQNLLMTLSKAKSNVIVMDSNDKPIKKFTYDLNLKPGQDTNFYYQVKYVDDQRNFKTLDIENYDPVSNKDERQFSLFFHTEEPRREKYSNISKSTKVDFIKLPNEKKVNPYGSDVVPLSAYLRVSNLLDDIVFSSLHLRGQKNLENGGTLVYNTSLYFSSLDNFYGEHYTRNIPWYIGYFDKTKNIQAGYVNGGAIGAQSSGKGIKGEIEFLPGNWGGAFYVRSPYFFNDHRLESYGFHHRFESKNFSNLTQYSHSHHLAAKMITDVISVSPKVRIANKHNINFTGAVSNRYSYYDPQNRFSRQGYLVGAGYTSSFFENIWRLNVRGTYTSKGFGAYGYERYYINHRSRIAAGKNLEISVINNYNEYRYDNEYFNYIPGNDRNYYFFNSINFYSEKYLNAVKPGLFYDIRNYLGNDFHMRGLNLSFNNYDITKNLQTSFISSIGFSRLMSDPEADEDFIYKLNTMIRYRNLSFTGYYNYGPLSPAMAQLKMVNNIEPQTLRTSLMHMFLFPDRHTALQSRFSYMYTNVYNHHSLNISPELFYFTNSGWRFSINPTYTFYSSKVRTENYNIPSYISEADYEFRRYSNDNFNIALSIKKDFGIPIPTTSDNFNDVNFTAFYDINGNKVKDNDEPGIENVVINLGDWSVITKGSGEATILNAQPGNFSLSAISLEDLNGWFPLIEDSLTVYKDDQVYIPFVKGVKVYGAVYIEQENINPLEDKKLDISGIKISAVDGYTFQTLTGADGSFEFYLPFGEYTISLDETVLNGRFFLLKNNFKLDLSKDVDNMYITFHIVEKKRKVRIKKFEEGDQ